LELTRVIERELTRVQVGQYEVQVGHCSTEGPNTFMQRRHWVPFSGSLWKEHEWEERGLDARPTKLESVAPFGGTHDG